MAKIIANSGDLDFNLGLHYFPIFFFFGVGWGGGGVYRLKWVNQTFLIFLIYLHKHKQCYCV